MVSKGDRKMNRPEYLVTYYPFTKNVSRCYKVVGDTEKYWKCRIDANGDTILINKRTLRLRGSDIQYHSWTKEEVNSYVYRAKLEKTVSKIDPSKLSVEQLESIIKIAEEKENDL
jgi:hypothetical protein